MNQFRSKTFAEMLFLVGVGLLAAAAVAGQSKTTKPETGKRKPLDGNTMTAKQFLSVVRYPQFINSWARLEGQIHHVSKGKRLKRKIEIRARLRPKEWRMQVILEGGERHLVRQIPADGLVGTTSIKQQDAGPGAATLQDFLIRYHRRRGFDQHHKAEGLMGYHVDHNGMRTARGSRAGWLSA
mgnify:CR=1 FL=1